MKVGILGGGQLARMMALAGIPMGLEFRCYDQIESACAAVASDYVQGRFDDKTALEGFAKSVDLVTYEFENIALDAVDHISQWTEIRPSRAALFHTQDRLREKQLFAELGIATAPFCSISSRADLTTAARSLSCPFFIKSRFGGYDGKGQRLVRTTDDLDAVWKDLAGTDYLAEGFVRFDREVSILAVCGRDQRRFYDLTENVHKNSILHQSTNCLGDPLQSAAALIAAKLADALDYLGVLSVEFFEVNGQLIANEYAPRVHNSGHWTIEGAACSQFENHLRAILDLPLGSCESIAQTTMLNCIGMMPDRSASLAEPATHYHDYQKLARPGRKLGHITRCAPLHRVAPSTTHEFVGSV